MTTTTRARVITSESVTEGHPDKLCDQISDAILDAYLARDPKARVACETVAAGDCIGVFGEITSMARVEIESLVRHVVRDIGYTDIASGVDADRCKVHVALREQSPEIGHGIDHEGSSDPLDALGAGDQGLMYGYATDETPSAMPVPIDLAHRLARRLAAVRKDGTLGYLRPDGKTQVSVAYDAAGTPLGVVGVVVSAQHDPDITIERIREDLRHIVVEPVIPEPLLLPRAAIHLNPTGSFILGGPTGDTGLTGRKVIVDTYGGVGRHGGGCFSGKDPTKVDRAGAYAARQAARWLVADGRARRAEVSLAYAIGVSRPIAVNVDTFSTAHQGTTDSELSALVTERFDFRPAAIIERLDLRRPIYRQVAAYGHFGREDLDLPWEKS